MTTQIGVPDRNRQRIITQRSYIEHIPNIRSTVRTELTIESSKPAKNIILTSTRPVFNPTAHDSDGEMLSIIPSEYSSVLLDAYTKQSAKKGTIDNSGPRQTNSGESVVWIKLPHGKTLERKAHRTITLEHEYETKTTGKIKFYIQPADDHPISYTFTKPDDYKFKKAMIFADGAKFDIKDERCAKYCRIQETSHSLTIMPRAGIKPLLFKCNTDPKPQIIRPPIFIFLFLYFAALFMVMLSWENNAALAQQFHNLLDKQIEIYVAIMAISFVLPRLVSNVYIRYHVWIVMGTTISTCVVGLLSSGGV